MYLSRLHLRDFRNFADQTLEFPPEGVAVIGDNGQGKTNLLEAIYYLEIFRSFRGAPDEQLVRFGEEVFRVEGWVAGEGGPAAQVAAAFGRRGRRKKVTLHGAEPPRLTDALGTVGAVVFSPSDVTMVSGSPSERRRFLDIVLSLAEPGYLRALQRFRQVLGHRNALLRQGAAPALVGAWDEGLVTWGSRVVAARARWVAEHAAGFAEFYAWIAGGAPGTLAYQPSVSAPEDPLDAAAVAEVFSRELERSAEREQRRGMTVVGPHRDDLRFGLEVPGAPPLDLRVFGSGGQQRTAAIALRMVEADTVRIARGREPTVLLDDVFAELDPGRSERILGWTRRPGRGQTILTAPKPGDVQVRDGELPRWGIRDGRIEPL